MRHIINKVLLLLFCLTISMVANAELYKGKTVKKRTNKADMEKCTKAQGSSELSINNVRARINTGGNMWFADSQARYYIPKDGTSTSMFAAALWIGGQDENLQLRVAALRFGQNGEDFWPGPLTVDQNASVDKQTCEKWDRHFRITKSEVEQFVASFERDGDGKLKPGTYDPATLTDIIRNWPAHGDLDKKQSYYIAPFFDNDQNGKYEPENGDYPYYDFENELCPATQKAKLDPGMPYVPYPTMESNDEDYGVSGGYATRGLVPAVGGLLVDQVLKGDETLWWVFNDNGNSHTESRSDHSIGLEIRAQAFAFTMNDEINNMTFYSYEIINRSTFTLTNTYFSQWVDPDLGYAADDFVGCDVKRGLGYCYNGKSVDGPGTGAYSGNPPAVGIDFFQGPYMDPTYKDEQGRPKDRPKIDTLWFDDSDKNTELLKKCKDTNGALNQILLTDYAEEIYLMNERGRNSWRPFNGDSVLACAINGVNFGNGIPDDERFGMRRFVYYNNDNANNGEPDKASDYYNYLRGYWKDGSRMRFGGNAYNTGVLPSNLECDFMFPGTTDPWNWGTKWQDPGLTDTRGWTEEQSNNSPQDRRFMQSAGPFTLKSGAINYITVGIPWAQAQTGGPYASVELLRTVDDKCQALFDNCFVILDGPDAPSLTIRELDRELILYLTNEAGNNVNEGYNKLDIRIPRTYYVKDSSYIVTRVDSVLSLDDGLYHHYNRRDTVIVKVEAESDREYHFEGYQIFQVKDQNVKVDEIYDQSKARLVAQCDIKNDISELINFTLDRSVGNIVPQVMVTGLNQGIKHSFSMTEDMFASTNDRRIVNNKQYYYIAIAYAYNEYKPYSPSDATKLDGQKEPYLAGRKLGTGGLIEPVCGIPHKVESSGSLCQASYGVMPEIFRIEGNGNGGLTTGVKWQKSYVELLMGKAGETPANNFIDTIGYEQNYGPIDIKVVDPLNLKAGKFIIRAVPPLFNDGKPSWTPETDITGPVDIDTCYWVIYREDGQKIVTNKDTVQYIFSDRPLSAINEQIILDLGISISMSNPKPVANTLKPLTVNTTTVLQGGNLIDDNSILYAVSSVSANSWLYGISDNDGLAALNWIRAGRKYESEDVNNTGGMTNSQYTGQDYFYLKNVSTTGTPSWQPEFIDPNFISPKLPAGWSPYRMTSFDTLHPCFTEYYYREAGDNSYTSKPITENPSLVSNDMNNLASVDIVFTNDKSKWTRCPVIELGIDKELTEGNAQKFQLRKHVSVDKDGNDDGTGTGMGWFPGYAINLETGERLNIVFGENSMYGQHNGRDMLWNPTPVTADGAYVFGGMHYIYVIGTTPHKLYGYSNPYYFMNGDFRQSVNVTPPRYDEGQWAYNLLSQLSLVTGISANPGDINEKGIFAGHQLFSSVMWVGMPLATCFGYGPGSTAESKMQTNIPSETTVSLRVRKPYIKNWTSNSTDIANPAQNDNRPMYMFSITPDIATINHHAATEESVLDLITVVPNPYLGYSTYELDQVQNLVKITNVPVNAYITIYTVDGTVVRKLRGSSSNTTNGVLPYVEWDLKNHKGLPIAGGTYLIHIKCDAGERLIKWFGALRPVDLNSFPN
ncbi:MAG: hypothetical protein LBR28_04320 [Bacteroidales bacterium]|jgi:hypothetical protein|nr:hypothetical protein [Bacteroidales bacterium]